MKTLIIIDMQNDFITGPLGTPEAREVEERIAAYLKYCNYNKVVLTRDSHFDDYLTTQEGKKLPIPHCTIYTQGWEISNKINQAITKNNNIGCIIALNKFSFGFRHLPSYVDPKSEVDFIGVCTDICIISNALILKAHYPESPIRVISSLCAGTTPEMHEKALDVMRSCQIEVI